MCGGRPGAAPLLRGDQSFYFGVHLAARCLCRRACAEHQNPETVHAVAALCPHRMGRLRKGRGKCYFSPITSFRAGLSCGRCDRHCHVVAPGVGFNSPLRLLLPDAGLQPCRNPHAALWGGHHGQNWPRCLHTLYVDLYHRHLWKMKVLQKLAVVPPVMILLLFPNQVSS